MAPDLYRAIDFQLNKDNQFVLPQGRSTVLEVLELIRQNSMIEMSKLISGDNKSRLEAI